MKGNWNEGASLPTYGSEDQTHGLEALVLSATWRPIPGHVISVGLDGLALVFRSYTKLNQ